VQPCKPARIQDNSHKIERAGFSRGTVYLGALVLQPRRFARLHGLLERGREGRPGRRHSEARTGAVVTYRKHNKPALGPLGDKPGRYGERRAMNETATDKVVTAIETAAGDSAVVASIALQRRTPPDAIRRALTRGGNGGASGPLGMLLDLLASGPQS
jgi:hypothetical protein